MIHMVRRQIQLTEQQAAALRRLSGETGKSVADLVRQGVDLYLGAGRRSDRQEQVERALRAIGRFSSGLTDVSAEHDRCLAEDFLK